MMEKNKVYLWIILGLTLTLIGTLFQYNVITQNGCKMPVLETESSIRLMQEEPSNFHFLYSDKSDINWQHLSDIIPMGNIGLFSIGDLLIWVGTILIISFVLFLGYNFIDSKVIQNKQKRL